MLSATKIAKKIYYLPLLWLSTGLIWFGQGNKLMVAFVLISSLGCLAMFKLKLLKTNFKNNYWLWSIILSLLFAVIAYETYGFSTQELRGYAISAVFLLTLPYKQIRIETAQMFLLIAAITCITISIWFYFIVGASRLEWPSNPIPLATIQGLVFSLSLAALLIKYKNKNTILLCACLFMSGMSVFFTESRGAIISVLLLGLFGGGYGLVRSQSLKNHWLLMFVFCCFTALLMTHVLSDRYQKTVDEISAIQNEKMDTSMGLRLQMWDGGLQLFAQKPILGHGELSVIEAASKIEGLTPSALGYMNGHLHNNFIDKLAKNGILGVILFAFVLFYPSWLCYNKNKAMLLLFLLPAIHYFLSSLSDAPFRNGDTLVAYLMVNGLLIHMLNLTEKE